MNPIDIKSYLKETIYPGRFLMLGTSTNGNPFVIYFIMGRSENSKNRIFEKTSYGIRTKAFDESKMTDPSLVIYSPVRRYDNHIIVTNGDQTDTIYDALKSGGTFESALMTRTFEPDPPIFTPRISGIINIKNESFDYKLSILKSDSGKDANAARFFYNYETPEKGYFHFIHTYMHDAKIPPSFEGEPKKSEIFYDISRFADFIWENINEDYKVSLYASELYLKDGGFSEKIINKN